jgi:hypothetical protein
MGQPDWASIKAANAAHLAMIAAWVAALATALAALFAALAVIWAKRAAQEAGKQARAAMKSVGWSRKAAEAAIQQSKAAMESVAAAREQVAIMQKEMAWAEPQPVVILNIAWKIDDAILGAVVTVTNVGEEMAFDVLLNPFSIPERPPKNGIISAVRFLPIPVLRKNETLPLKPMQSDLFLPPLDAMFQKYTVDLRTFFQTMISETADIAELVTGKRDTTSGAGIVTIQYCNARGAAFQQRFILTVYAGNRVECHPEGSLVKNRISLQ